ncbi:MAG: bifunctional phosphoribosylaminoimidazolecarboxamide formyltransferase/IMP cyclohydrolase [Armatimonadota bacterium]|nr:bifunctional phosphoribosylaminoimidazolecarboxamide formyltransferase/IMP cyclohydrolase [Armatimonadota bacterium]
MNKYALLSVTDKSGIAEFAAGLIHRGFLLLSTGGTAAALRASGLDVTSISDYTGQPEILGGRVKTLHPKIHGGLLGDTSDDGHLAEMISNGISPISVLAVNLYPFEQVVKSGSARDEEIENIDIGGPAMLRAAAKNADNVLVVTDPADYPQTLAAIDQEDADFRRSLQAKVFAHTAFYDSLIAERLSHNDLQSDTISLGLRISKRLRYGENPHQSAALCISPFGRGGIPNATQVWGKEISYNNVLDADAAWELVNDLSETVGRQAVAIIKHGNPCGAAWYVSASDSFRAARASDPISAFGGIVAVPGVLSEDTAMAMAEKGNFFEVIVCGSIDASALGVFKERSGWGQDVRILEAGEREGASFLSVRTIRGGALVQASDADDPIDWRVVTEAQPTDDEQVALRMAWATCKHVKSNAIVVASAGQMLGAGAGQMNRVQSVRLALEQAGDSAKGAALASDAFFPFPDSIEASADAGVAAIVQPGGSKKDAEVVDAANRMGVKMVFTGVRHFRH